MLDTCFFYHVLRFRKSPSNIVCQLVTCFFVNVTGIHDSGRMSSIPCPIAARTTRRMFWVGMKCPLFTAQGLLLARDSMAVRGCHAPAAFLTVRTVQLIVIYMGRDTAQSDTSETHPPHLKVSKSPREALDRSQSSNTSPAKGFHM